MKYSELATAIIRNIGGEKNVNSLTHCATRLRFNLIDENKVDSKKIENTDGILGAVNKGGQYQIIIGNDVANVYKEVIKQLPKVDEPVSGTQNKGNVLSRLIDTLTGIFTPILPAITAAGMLKAVLSLLVVFNIVSVEEQSYQVVNFIADSAFYFLPILLASSTAKKFNTNPYLAMMLGGVLLHPNFLQLVSIAKEGGENLSLFGLPIMAVTYSSTVIPIILAVILLSYVEPIADRVSPNAIKFFTKPLICIAVVGIATLTILGPIGYVISDWIAAGISFVESYSPWVVPMIIGIFSPLLVATGTHYGLVPIGINNRMTVGYDTVIYPGMLVSNMAQGAASLAVGFKTKSKKIKQVAYSAGVTGIFGIVEPAIYGVTLKYKTPLYAAMISGGVGGFIVGILRVRNFSGGVPGLLTLPSYIGDNTLSHFYNAIIGAAVSVILSFVLTLFMYKDKIEEVETDESKKNQDNSNIMSPLTGQIVNLSEVPDTVFSTGMLGEGVAIIPSEGRLVAPADGEITVAFPTGHAIGMLTTSGAEILMHIGLDTVELNGKFFTVHKQVGDNVKKGDLLVEFDLQGIKNAGYETITPVIITNSAQFFEVTPSENGAAELDTQIINLVLQA